MKKTQCPRCPGFKGCCFFTNKSEQRNVFVKHSFLPWGRVLICTTLRFNGSCWRQNSLFPMISPRFVTVPVGNTFILTQTFHWCLQMSHSVTSVTFFTLVNSSEAFQKCQWYQWLLSLFISSPVRSVWILPAKKRPSGSEWRSLTCSTVGNAKLVSFSLIKLFRSSVSSLTSVVINNDLEQCLSYVSALPFPRKMNMAQG